MALTPHGLKGKPANCLNMGKPHCPNGHEYTEENTYWYNNGRRCKECKRELNRRNKINAMKQKQG
jgi:hypothetical protein